MLAFISYEYSDISLFPALIWFDKYINLLMAHSLRWNKNKTH